MSISNSYDTIYNSYICLLEQNEEATLQKIEIVRFAHYGKKDSFLAYDEYNHTFFN